MPIGKNFYGYNYGPTLTSQLMEEKPPQGISVRAELNQQLKSTKMEV